MSKKVFFVFLALAPVSIFSMLACKRRRPSAKLTVFAKKPSAVPVKDIPAIDIVPAPKQTSRYFIVNPQDILHINTANMHIDNQDVLAFEAILRNGDEVGCFEFRTEPKQIMAFLWTVLFEEPLDPIAIPNENFDIIKNHFENIQLASQTSENLP